VELRELGSERRARDVRMALMALRATRERPGVRVGTDRRGRASDTDEIGIGFVGAPAIRVAGPAAVFVLADEEPGLDALALAGELLDEHAADRESEVT